MQKSCSVQTIHIETEGTGLLQKEFDLKYKTSQELRMLSRSLSDCQSLALDDMIQLSQFVRNSQLSSLLTAAVPIFGCLDDQSILVTSSQLIKVAVHFATILWN